MTRQEKQTAASVWCCLSLLMCCGVPSDDATTGQFIGTVLFQAVNLVASFLTVKHYSKHEPSANGN